MKDVLKIFIFYLLERCITVLVQGQSFPTVTTNVGTIQGLWEPNGNLSMFLGVPYGKVNKTNPFGAALPYPDFEEIYQANDDSIICPQPEGGSLDCLRLNIFSPVSARKGSNLPVLVWIHGGDFTTGSGGEGGYYGRFLVKHDVILVTINYRLGPYGFLCLDIPEVPGNQGLKDQLLALRWVNRNIDAFGGDPNLVTIFGEGAGSTSVDLHLFSQPDKVFKRIITNSGQAFSPQVGSIPDKEAPLKIVEALGLHANDVQLALYILAGIDTKVVIAAAANLTTMYPCVENRFENVERFLSDYPLYLNASVVKDTSLLIGFNEYECIDCGDRSTGDFYEILISSNLNLAFNFDDEGLLNAEQHIRRFYIGDKEVNRTQDIDLAEFESDFKYIHPTTRSIQRYLENGAESVFYYIFFYDGERNVNEIINKNNYPGAVHSDLLGYLFDFKGLNLPDPPSEKAQLMIDRITTMWTNFAKYGNPTPEISDILPVKWEPITVESPQYYMNINSYDMKILTRPFQRRMAFWDLFFRQNKKFLNGYRSENIANNVVVNIVLLVFSILIFTLF